MYFSSGEERAMVDFKSSLSELANGSDIRGFACLDRDSNKYNLGLREVAAIAEAFVIFLKERYAYKTVLRISLGHDSRVTADRLCKAVIYGLLAQELAEVFFFALCSTPAMFMSTLDESLSCDAAIMLTASHLPRMRNGIKFFTKEGGLEARDISRIIEIADEIYEKKYAKYCDEPVFAKDLSTDKSKLLYQEMQSFYQKNLNEKIKLIDFLDMYSQILKKKIIADLASDETELDRPLEGLHIVVDAGNGAGGFYATKVLQSLGANIEASLFLEPDGTFPNHIPNPEDKTALPMIQETVKRVKADLGIIFDTDVDRAAVISSDGKEINRNSLIALISHILLEEEPGATIVTDSITSLGLNKFIAKRNGKHFRFKRGYKNVINQAIKLNEEGVSTPLAIETSGHAAFRENYFLDDGAYLATRILIYLAKLKRSSRSLESCLNDLEEAEFSCEKRFTILVEDFKSYGEGIIDELRCLIKDNAELDLDNKVLKHTIVEPNYEGLRVNVTYGQEEAWFLLRLSLHEPLLVLNIEGDRAVSEKVLAEINKYFSQKAAIFFKR